MSTRTRHFVRREGETGKAWLERLKAIDSAGLNMKDALSLYALKQLAGEVCKSEESNLPLSALNSSDTSRSQSLVSLAELLSGAWVGTWTRGGETELGVTLRKGMLTLPLKPARAVSLRIEDEGHGRFRGTIGTEKILGIWRYESGVLTLCLTTEEKGYPWRFSDENQQDLFVLGMR
jgi:hypothetical protein